MDSPITRFSINGLFGYKNISIQFTHSIIIVIGENGFGKTSILNALTFTLKGEWKKLQCIKFSDIQIEFGDNVYNFSHKILTDFCEYQERRRDEDGKDVTDFVKDNIGDKEFSKLCEFVAEGRKKDYHNMISNNSFLRTIPESILYNSLFARLDREKIFGVFREITNTVNGFGCEILYLPTYRRVEVDLDSLHIPRRRATRSRFEDERIYDNDWNNAVIRFGMEDVQERIDRIRNTISQSFIKGFAEASGDMIRQLLKGNRQKLHELTCDRRQMQIVLARIGNGLTEEEKEQILSMVESQSSELLENKYLVYFLEQLLAVYKKQERYDTAIKNFCSVCNKYLTEKEFYFDESNVTLKIYRKVKSDLSPIDGNEVKLSQLSSGEKQIVSIFSQVYLNVDSRFIILLDEPELSLSIFWQENLLPDLIGSTKVDFLMAVTHSPFIFGQKLKQYTVGINEFLAK